MNDGQDLSDDRIISELSALHRAIDDSRREATARFEKMLARDLYDAHEETRRRIYRELEDTDREQGEAIADLEAEATRKDRDRRRFWSLLIITMAGVIGTGLLAWSTALHTSRVVCVPAPVGTQIVCQVVR